MTTNLHRKANACRADLKFLLGIVPAEWVWVRFEVKNALMGLENPNEYLNHQRINAAWQLAALIHEKIRKHGLTNNNSRNDAR